MSTIVSHLPASDQQLETYRQAQSSDVICQQVLKYGREGLPDKGQIDSRLKVYWSAQGELTESNRLLMYGQRMVVPKSLQAETLNKLHEGHRGITRSCLQAKISVWWPGLSKQLTSFIKKCPECARDSRPARESLMPTSLPSYPWQKVATDIFNLKEQEYLVIVDYFSRYPEVQKLKMTTTQSVVNILKAAFARHGIPEILRSEMDHNSAPKNLRTSSTSTSLSMTLAAPNSHPAMDKRKEQCRQSRTY